MKHNRIVLRSILLCFLLAVLLLCGCGSSGGTNTANTVGEPWEVPYLTTSGLRTSCVEICSLTAQKTSDGSTRFTLDYNAPAGWEILAFDSEGGNPLALDSMSETSGTRERRALTLTPEQVESIKEASFYFRSDRDETEHFSVFFFPENGFQYTDSYYEDEEAYSGLLTDGQTVGEKREAYCEVMDRLPGEESAVHGLTVQDLDNGYTRLVLDYTLPLGCEISIFDSSGKGCFQGYAAHTPGGRAELAFDLNPRIMSDCSDICVRFQLADVSATVALRPHQPPRLSGRPVGEPWDVEFEVEDHLALGGGEIHRLSAQKLDNGKTRYTLEYTLPARYEVFIFDAPDAKRLSLSAPQTTGGRAELLFDIEEAISTDCELLAVVFFIDDSNRLFVSFRP